MPGPKPGPEPGPASTVGDHPPTNPAIRVRFPSVVDGFFFRVRGRHLYATPINSKYSLQRKAINAIYWNSRKRSLHSLSVRKGTYLQIGPMGRSFKRWASNHTTLLRNSTLQTTLATCDVITTSLTIRRSH